MHQNIDIHYYFKQVEEQVETSIKSYVEENIEKKMDAYFKKVLHHEDAVIDIDVKIERHEDGRYSWTFLFTLDGKQYTPYKREMFESVRDLVNHAFDHLKEQIASERDQDKGGSRDKTQNVNPVTM